jgi:hypothetical protein
MCDGEQSLAIPSGDRVLVGTLVSDVSSLTRIRSSFIYNHLQYASLRRSAFAGAIAIKCQENGNNR